MEQEQDLVVIMDDEGNELTMEVLDYFFYEGQEYAVMVEYNEEGCTCDHEDEACDCCEQQEAYIMRVVPVGDDQEEFVPVEEDLLEKLIDFVQNDLYENEDDEDEDLEEDGEDGQ